MDKQTFPPASGQPDPTDLVGDTPESIGKSQKNEVSDGPSLRAEIIAIGDELSSGVRLDTNSQWISQSLDRLGVQTAFHSTVGDDLGDMLAAFEVAAGRVDLIFTTGGLGPTADDLTRNIIAQLAGVELVLDESVLQHIKTMYQSRGREMPPNNEVQAWFPAGAIVIDNPEGTAPGIEFAGVANVGGKQNPYRMFSFPGVPAELKQMWHASVQQRLIELYAIDSTIFHHTIHCFGTGESAIEMQLPDLIRRGRDPLVGITASAATISLRVATRGANREDCLVKMRPTIEIIHERLGDLVYGENGEQLEHVVARKLIANQQTIGVFDWGLSGDVARRLAAATPDGGCLRTSRAYSQPIKGEVSIAQRLQQILQDESWHEGADVVLLVGPIDRDETAVASGESYYDVAIGWLDQNGEQVSIDQAVSLQRAFGLARNPSGQGCAEFLATQFGKGRFSWLKNKRYRMRKLASRVYIDTIRDV